MVVEFGSKEKKDIYVTIWKYSFTEKLGGNKIPMVGQWIKDMLKTRKEKEA